jgi:hypothetical protein
MPSSWEQREAEQNTEDEARLQYLGQLESQRQDMAQSGRYGGGLLGEGLDIDGMFDGRPGLDETQRPLVYLWLVGGALLLVAVVAFFIRKLAGH